MNIGANYGARLVSLVPGSFLEVLWLCFKAIPTTMLIVVACVSFGLLVALPLSVVHASRKGIGYFFSSIFTFLFTGTPLLVQLYVIYFGIGSLDVTKELVLSHPGLFRGPFFWVWAAMSLNTAAYSTEIFAGSIRNTDRGEIEAAHALGLSKFQVMRRITLPSGLRRSLPSYSNELLMVMHSTSLASLVTLYEITGHATQFSDMYYNSFTAYTAAAVVYLGLSTCFVVMFRLAEKRFLAHLKR